MPLSWVLLQMKHIFGTKNVKPVFKTESGNKEAAQRSRHFIKKIPDDRVGRRGWGYQSNDVAPASQLAATHGTLRFHLFMDGIQRRPPHPGSHVVVCCGQQPGFGAFGGLGFQVQSSHTLTVGSWSWFKLPESPFPPS